MYVLDGSSVFSDVSYFPQLAVLKSLQTLDPDKSNIIRWHGSFLHEERICLEFELLDQSLFDFMEQRRNEPLPTKELRPVIHQVGRFLFVIMKHSSPPSLPHVCLLENEFLMNNRVLTRICICVCAVSHSFNSSGVSWRYTR